MSFLSFLCCHSCHHNTFFSYRLSEGISFCRFFQIVFHCWSLLSRSIKFLPFLENVFEPSFVFFFLGMINFVSILSAISIILSGRICAVVWISIEIWVELFLFFNALFHHFNSINAQFSALNDNHFNWHNHHKTISFQFFRINFLCCFCSLNRQTIRLRC